MGAFVFGGKVGVGFGCRSRRCGRIKCSLNLQRTRKDQERLIRVDLFELLQIFYGEQKMPLSRAMGEVSAGFNIKLHAFDRSLCAVPKAAVYRQILLYRKEYEKLICNFSNLRKRSRIVRSRRHHETRTL
jgi:hypothetical protein